VQRSVWRFRQAWPQIGLPCSSAKATHEVSGVPGHRLPGRLVSSALRAICDLEKLIGILQLALGSPKRLEVTLSSELWPSTFGCTEPRRFRCRVPRSALHRATPGTHERQCITRAALSTCGCAKNKFLCAAFNLRRARRCKSCLGNGWLSGRSSVCRRGHDKPR
jgi:hypothetical protein